MNIRILAATIALGTMCAVAPAGGELQAYERPYTGYGYGAYGGGYAAAPMPANYARPVSHYYGGYGCGPCATMPYGTSYGRPGGVFGNDMLTAGLLGVGIGYLLFH